MEAIQNPTLLQRALSIYTPNWQRASGVALILSAVVFGGAIGAASTPAGWVMVALAVLGVALAVLAKYRASPNQMRQITEEEQLSQRRIQLLLLQRDPVDVKESLVSREPEQFPEFFNSVRKLDLEAARKQIQKIDPRDRRKVFKKAIKMLPSEESDLFKVMYPEDIQKEFERTTEMRNSLKRGFRRKEDPSLTTQILSFFRTPVRIKFYPY